jgi:ABC-type oligopeptide transport system substrate-binding subunit
MGNYNVCGYQSEAFDALVNEKLPAVRTMEEMEALLLELQAVAAEEIPLITIGYADTLQVCNTDNYNGWVAGKGMNVVNVFSFLPN